MEKQEGGEMSIYIIGAFITIGYLGFSDANEDVSWKDSFLIAFTALVWPIYLGWRISKMEGK